MQRMDLGQRKWMLGGWEANAWRLRRSMELGSALRPEVGPVPARVPGSVHGALRAAGLLPDWNVGLNSQQCEWVEHRHWEYTTVLPAKWFAAGGPVRLHCAGLDYSGTILIDAQPVATFAGTLRPHTIDLGTTLTPDRDHVLSIIFEGAPAEQGQMGYTSRSHFFRPRFAYKWDWCPRIVTLGVWDALTLEIGEAPRIVNVRPHAELASDLSTGSLRLDCKLWSGAAGRVAVRARLTHAGRELACVQRGFSIDAGEQQVALKLPKLNVEPWWPNGLGAQNLYNLEVELLPQGRNAERGPLDAWGGRVGFKRVRWVPCAGGPKDALPWICEVNGKALFMQGINWTPIRPNFHDLTRSDYASRIRTYQRMGVNLLRVWGGGLIEKRDFYDLCDEQGLLVWQEFPLSSSGIDNTPPSDPAAVAELVSIATSAIERRAGHASLLMWCGGNELSSSDDRSPGCGRPWGLDHPCLQVLAETVALHDPGRRFVPTSPNGPTFGMDPANVGKGVHHVVHGPWRIDESMAAWQAWWDASDALLHAEMGCPGASPLDLLERYNGELPLWPPSPDNPLWRHPGAWWTEYDRFHEALPKAGERRGLARYVELSQGQQAEALGYAVASCKRRYPACAGVILWMGHDCFPCTANTSLLDFDGRMKPAARALARIFRRPTPRLKTHTQNKRNR